MPSALTLGMVNDAWPIWRANSTGKARCWWVTTRPPDWLPAVMLVPIAT